MEDRSPQDAWAEACKKTEEYVNAASFEDAGDAAIHAAHEMLAIAHQLKGVACCSCNGHGETIYGDTSGWMRTGGGQMVTSGVCERCWGTGRADRTGPDLSRINRIEKQNEHLHLLAAEHDCEMSRVTLVLEQFCHQCAEGSDPGACPDCLLHSLGASKEKDSTRLTDDSARNAIGVERLKVSTK